MKHQSTSKNGNSGSNAGRTTERPFKLNIIRDATGERILRIHALHPCKGVIIISRDHAYYFMEQVIHFVAALNKSDCESS